jgi:two-component system sensor histidine kinase UhpB
MRLARPKVLEFAAITDRFNALAGALDAARAENLALSRRLVTAQDDERRRTALELHDEVGPSLFGLKANAASITKAADALPESAAKPIRDRTADLTGIIEHLQSLNRSILNRLWPMALGHVPLPEILSELVCERAGSHPGIGFSHDIDTLAVPKPRQAYEPDRARPAKGATIIRSTGRSPCAAPRSATPWKSESDRSSCGCRSRR